MKTFGLKGKGGKGLLAIAVVCLVRAGAAALDLTAEEAAALKNYEAAINNADPAAAKKFLEDAALADKLRLAEPGQAAGLVAHAQAVADLEELLDRTWKADQDMELSRALALRIDFNRPLEKVGIGPAPESLLPWMGKYKKYSAAKTLTVKKAIRQFETVFGTSTTEGKTKWESSTIRERDAILSEKAAKALDRLINFRVTTDKDFQDEVRNTAIFRYLDHAGRARLEKYLGQMAVVEAAKLRLTPPQIAGLKGPVEQQMYILGGMFDNSRDRGSVTIERRVDAARQSRPGETLSFQENRLLAAMLETAVPGELKGTAAGDKVLKFYESGARPEVAIESCQGCYAKYEPAAGKLVLDAEMVRQYMRVNNLRAETLLKDKAQLTALAKYVSPMFVHEATHQMQHAWADRAHIYKPYVQEDELESVAMEALYTTEKMKKDGKFRDLFLKMEHTTVYAQKRLEMMNRFNEGGAKFDRLIRQVYYYGIPSFDAASSQILSAVSSELERRKSLSAADAAALENGGAGLDAVMGMTVQELAGSVAGIKTAALKKIQDDMLHKAVYAGRYESASEWTNSLLGAVRARTPPKSAAVPAL